MDSRQPQERHSPPPDQTDPESETYDAGKSAEHLIDSALGTPTPLRPSPTALPDLNAQWSSTTSLQQLGHGSHQNPTDHVFPIRSMINVDPPGRTSSGEHGYFPSLESTGPSPQRPALTRLATETTGRRIRSMTSESLHSGSTAVMSSTARLQRKRQQTTGGTVSNVPAGVERHGIVAPIPIYADDASDDEKSDVTGTVEGSHASSRDGRAPAEPLPDALMTARFQHVMTDEGHAVITGRERTLQYCEDEPIHTPGAIQGFGLLLAIREEVDGRFQVRYASENSARLIGYTPQELFRLDNFMDILTEEQAGNLLDHIDFIRDEEADPVVNGPEVFSLSIRPPKKKSVKLWCGLHINQAHPELVICEFELDDDHEFPLRPSGELTPDVPEDTLHANPTLEELTESTEILSRPLRVLRSARKRRGEAGAMQVFDILSQVQEQLASAPNLETFLKILVGIVKELTGFHRVMIYQFDSSFNGKVVTELVNPVHTKDLYKGLHFPASDIPKQARDLYKINKVRLLYDRDLETARMVCRSVEDLETPLDMTHAYLRAMSPIHLKYLANMSVRASMSISINAFNELWGLIACHSYGNKGMRVSFPIRKMCRHIGDSVSRNIERLSYASRLQARKLINTMPTDKNPSGYIIASSDDLLKLFDADFGMLSIREETKILGKLEHSQEALAMLEYLRLRKFTSVVTSQDIREDFPDLRYTPGFAVIAGLLYVPLSVGGSDFIVFFRRGQIREVKWAGNPYEKFIKEGTAAYLEPRKSFKTWHETVVGKCREWSEEQVETAAVLCLVYGKFIEVWRQKEAALQSSRLTRLLLANSAHEVRTPLNAIINYLEIALEGSLDQETRDNLAKSHSASKSLIYVINDLLDLTKTEEGQDLVKDEIFDLPACIREATEPFRTDTKRKGISYEIIEHPGLPQYVFGDQRRVRQAVTNVTANAVQHTSAGSVRIELYVAEVLGSRVRVDIVVEDTGKGISNSKLDELFRELEQVTIESEEARPSEKQKEGVPGNATTLGLGLAMVARIVRNMDGQLRLKSEEGKGSRFVIQLPFELPPDDSPEAVADAAAAGPGGPAIQDAAASSMASVSTAMGPTREGEVMLVDRGGSSSSAAAAASEGAVPGKRRSMDDVSSLHSHQSGMSISSNHSNRSDADRLIDAIQTPLSLGEPETEATRLHRRQSRGAYYKPFAGVLDSGNDASRPVSSHGAGLSASERPPGPPRSISSPGAGGIAAEAAVSDASATAGLQFVTDSKTPIRPVRIPEEYKDQPEAIPQQSTDSRVLFEIPDKTEGAAGPSSSSRAQQQHGPPAAPTSSTHPVLPPPSTAAKDEDDHGRRPTSSSSSSRRLRVLIAEDDPINLRILRKRLDKAGHAIAHAANGEDCAQLYAERSRDFDVVLMDMQMPIADGLASTRIIRAFEQSSSISSVSSSSSSSSPAFAGHLSPLAAAHGRVPVFAVSASLVERERDVYVGAGFDGWILKPIDFRRLETLLAGIRDDGVRDACLYQPGEWERGGWFARRKGAGTGEGGPSLLKET